MVDAPGSMSTRTPWSPAPPARRVPYVEIGPIENDPKAKERYAHRLIKKLSDLGFNASLEVAANPTA
jgi:hypothetical protein